MSLERSFTVPFKKCLNKSGLLTTYDAADDFSSTQGVYEVISNATPGLDIALDRFHFVIISATAAADLSELGDLTGLTNGMSIKYDVASTLVYTLGTYKNNLQLELVSDSHTNDEASGTDHVYEYILNFDEPFILRGGSLDRLYVELDDNLSSLNGLYFTASGTTTTAKFSL